MRSSVVIPVVAVLIAGASLAVAGECTCKTAKVDNGWCSECNVGYVSGVKLESKELYDALAGVKVDKEKVQCPGCKTALAKNGACDHCHVRFEHGVAYKSPVAAKLAAGKPMAHGADEIKCPGCKKAAKAGEGWCDHCGGGIVGHRWFSDKKAYQDAVAARATLVKAAQAAEKCKGCAIAMVTDGKCDHCNVSFKDGKVVKKAP